MVISVAELRRPLAQCAGNSMLEIIEDTLLSIVIATIGPAVLGLVGLAGWVLAVIASVIAFGWTIWRHQRRQVEGE